MVLQFFIPKPLRFVSAGSQAIVALVFVRLEVALAPMDVAIAFERQDVRGQPVEEPAVVAHDDRTANKVLHRLFDARSVSTSRSFVGSSSSSTFEPRRSSLAR